MLLARTQASGSCRTCALRSTIFPCCILLFHIAFLHNGANLIFLAPV